MNITPDQVIIFSWHGFSLNATIVYTWLVMLLLTSAAAVLSRRLADEVQISYWQNLLEVLVVGIRDQIAEVSRQQPSEYLPFIGTLFIFILVCNLFAVVPGYLPPTASLSTTAALAICVFAAAPLFGIAHEGLRHYLQHYLHPTVLMLPFNLLGEVSRTLAMAVRLYGNVMSGTIIVGILLSLVPFFFPVVMQLFGLITGVIQAYIFAVLAMVYIASASVAHQSIQNSATDQ